MKKAGQNDPMALETKSVTAGALLARFARAGRERFARNYKRISG
jgi:hypothetical protein